MDRIRKGAGKLKRAGLKKVALGGIGVPVSVATIYRSKLFDLEWYRLQLVGKSGMRLSRLQAIVHYVIIGRRQGLSPHPLFSPEYFDHAHWRGSAVDPLVRYLLRDKHWSKPTHPLFDPTKAPDLLDKKTSPLEYFLENNSKEAQLPITNSKEGVSWKEARESLFRYQKEHHTQESLRAKSRPTTNFNKQTERRLISKHSDEKPHTDTLAISIVMPVWNRKSAIGTAIRSVQSQSCKNWELIIVDDGSDDGTIEEVERIAKKDSRIKLYKQAHKGVCEARNLGIENSHADYIAFLDSDNEWTPYFLQTILGEVRYKNLRAAYAAIKMNSGGTIRYRVTKPDKLLLQYGNYIDLNTLVVEKAILQKIGGFDPALRRMVDYDLVLRIADHVLPTYIPVVGVEYSDHQDANRITTTERTSWDSVVKNKNLLDWNRKKKRDAKKTSVIISARNSALHLTESVKSVVQELPEKDTEIILVDNSSNPSVGSVAKAISIIEPRVRLVRSPMSLSEVLGFNVGYMASSGEKLVFVRQTARLDKGWLKPLLSALNDSSVDIAAPISLNANRTIASAGVFFPNEHPNHLLNLLAGHNLYDAGKLNINQPVSALPDGCVAIHASKFNKTHGFNPLYEAGFEAADLSVRVSKGHKDTVRIATSSTAVYHKPTTAKLSTDVDTFFKAHDQVASPVLLDKVWRQLGFRCKEYKQGVNRWEVEPLLEEYSKSEKGLRWAIKIASPPDDRRFAWGDTYFGQALADALNKLDQEAYIDYLGAHDRPSAYLDDVVVDIRGLADPKPQPNKANIMWVISHPDDVDPETVKAFDIVYAAGQKWADYMSKESGKKIEFLPQCTDTTRFKPPVKTNSKFADKTLFVGNSRNVLRSIVRDAIEANIDLVVYGGDWTGLIDRRYVKGTFIPNDELAEVYGSSKFVLNDHWDDMRKWGFISNRVFDVAASGGEVITDDIPGVGDVFNADTVRIYKKVEDLRALNNLQSASKERRKENYEYVKKHHSFDARAKKMIHDVKNLPNNDI